MAANEAQEQCRIDALKIRTVQKEIQKGVRQQKKDRILSRKREFLSDVQQSFRFVSPEEMGQMGLSLVKSKDSLGVLQHIRNGAVFGESQIESFLRIPGSVNKLVGKLCGNNAELQLEAAACITNLAAGSHKSTVKVAKAAGAYLVTHMRGDSHFLQDQCAWAAGNIANDCKKCSNIMIAQGLLPALQALLSSAHPDVVQSAVYALNACSQYDSSDLHEMVRDNLHDLTAILNRNDVSRQTVADTMCVLSNISCNVVEHCNLAEQRNLAIEVLGHLANATRNDNVDIVLATPLVRCLGNLSTGSSDLCKFVLEQEAFQTCVRSIMNSTYSYLHKEILWVLNNLLNYEDESNAGSWCWVLEWIRIFLSPLDDNAVQALYFLCVLKATKRDFDAALNASGLLEAVTTLSGCGKQEIEEAAKHLCSMFNLPVQHA